ncbi:uncharacterized protein LOC107472085 [Arachis duranensis]|uniref:Uncharacterized protein LOC107472085 n=1 Tax=Arachis duranensis TaxID=130453 RepID=A0A6P4C831_ARADU|nr:uncharacterized protein LOC107472085 [Arachis duranensis]XP_025691679.1 uncharacterized protein LOC112792573 [Arachis hypogaea]
MESLRKRLESVEKANNAFKREVETLREQLTQANEKLQAAENKASAAKKKLEQSDATVSRLVEREMALEGQVGMAQGRVTALEKERDEAVLAKEAVETELAWWKTKYKEVVKQGKGAILATEEALKAQVKIVAPDFDTLAIGVFKMIKDGKIVDMPRK